MKRLILAVVVALVGSMPAFAQDGVLDHYHAYRAALTQNNLALAESEASQALQASIIRDGDGGRTAVLALNLATTRLTMGHASDASEPAHRALDIARANAHSGVDPALAEIVVARVDLGLARPNADAALRTALAHAQTRQEWVTDVYAGAVELGRWANEHDQLDVAREAWDLAASHSQGADTDPALANGYAKIQFARAIIMTTPQRRLSRADAFTAQEALRVASRAFLPSVRHGIPSSGPNAAQRSYAESTAWQSALSAIIMSQGISVPWPAEPQQPETSTDASPAEDPRPVCNMQLVAAPLPTYPRPAQNNLIVGAVVLYYETGEDGSLTRYDVLAAVGPVFPGPVLAVVPHWRMRRLPGSAPNCRMTTFGFRNVDFTFR